MDLNDPSMQIIHVDVDKSKPEQFSDDDDDEPAAAAKGRFWRFARSFSRKATSTNHQYH